MNSLGGIKIGTRCLIIRSPAHPETIGREAIPHKVIEIPAFHCCKICRRDDYEFEVEIPDLPVDGKFFWAACPCCLMPIDPDKNFAEHEVKRLKKNRRKKQSHEHA